MYVSIKLRLLSDHVLYPLHVLPPFVSVTFYLDFISSPFDLNSLWGRGVVVGMARDIISLWCLTSPPHVSLKGCLLCLLRKKTQDFYFVKSVETNVLSIDVWSAAPPVSVFSIWPRRSECVRETLPQRLIHVQRQSGPH